MNPIIKIIVALALAVLMFAVAYSTEEVIKNQVLINQGIREIVRLWRGFRLANPWSIDFNAFMQWLASREEGK